MQSACSVVRVATAKTAAITTRHGTRRVEETGEPLHVRAELAAIAVAEKVNDRYPTHRQSLPSDHERELDKARENEKSVGQVR
jgi:hypothetical protein